MTDRYQQGIHVTIETTVPTEPHEVSAALRKTLGVTVLSCAVDMATKVEHA